MSQTNENQKHQPIARRRKLLPVWIKIFLWIFMIFGFIAPVGVVMGALGIDFNLSLYGLETVKALSPTGLIIITLFALKGAVSFGLWTEKDWAVKLAIVDAAIGTVACTIIMFVLPFIGNGSFEFSIRLELVALVPYLIKMLKIRDAWENWEQPPTYDFGDKKDSTT